MLCDCSNRPALELDRPSINRRVKESRTLKKRFTVLAENPDLRITLYRCAACGQFWQSGWEWSFRGEIYLFQVPPIDEADWLQEPFVQPADILIYDAMMEDYLSRNTFETGDRTCRLEDCGEPALRLSVFCKRHLIESLQRSEDLPMEPTGRRFPPYEFGDDL